MRTPNTTNSINGGIQKIYDFTNGYQASVVRHDFSYGHEDGLWELAVIKDGRIVYDTPITNNVIGYLSEEGVDKVLNQIEALS